jgi:DNA polymerase elongation subunit (family B)
MSNSFYNPKERGTIKILPMDFASLYPSSFKKYFFNHVLLRKSKTKKVLNKIYDTGRN